MKFSLGVLPDLPLTKATQDKIVKAILVIMLEKLCPVLKTSQINSIKVWNDFHREEKHTPD